jgi:glutaredoxin
MARFNLADYATVQERIEAFWKKYPDGAIVTRDLTTDSDRERKQWRVYAEVYFKFDEIRPRGTGLAFEIDGGAGANQTSAYENAETSAIGRALATANFTTSKHRASRQEMQKAERGSANVAQITTNDIQACTNLKELEALWAKSVDTGDSTKLIADFTARKKALSQ